MIPGALRVEGLEPAAPEFCDQAGNFLQSWFWGSFKARFGWAPFSFRIRWAGGAEGPLLVLVRPLLPGFSFAYVPWGPLLPEAPPGPGWPGNAPASGLPGPGDSAGPLLASLARALRPYLPRSLAFIRFDPPWSGGEAPAVGPPLIKAPADIQAPDTVLIDLTPPEEGILARMNPKWRYNIRLAARKGVAVRRAGEEELPAFYALLQETARRDGIAIHSPDYYRGLFAHGRDYRGAGGPELRLYLAEEGGEALGALVALFRGAGAFYLYGASADRRRNLMASYALQWRALRDARAWGCQSYDLFGIPPSGDPRHPMAGLYRFKTGFGGRIIRRPGSWDYPCRPLGALLFRGLEKFRKLRRDRKKISPALPEKSGSPTAH